MSYVQTQHTKELQQIQNEQASKEVVLRNWTPSTDGWARREFRHNGAYTHSNNFVTHK